MEVGNTLAYYDTELFTVAKKVNGSCKHSSLLRYGGRKLFIVQATGVNFRKFSKKCHETISHRA